jgi:plastocyanin
MLIISCNGCFVFVSILGFCAGFLYNNKFHNVARVTEEEFLACKASAVTHTNGDTVFHLNHPGRQFYICTHVGHCAAGMKLEVIVKKA